MRRMLGRFKTIQLVLVVAIVAVMGFIAWRLTLGDGSQVPVVQNANDLTKLEQQLNGTSIEDTAEQELDEATTF